MTDNSGDRSGRFGWEEEEIEVTEGEASPDEESIEAPEIKAPEMEPTVTLVGGLSSSGKSSWIRENAGDVTIIEPEELKADIDGYEGWNSAMFATQAAEKVREIVQKSVQNKQSLLIENNFSNPDTAIKIAESFKAQGYRVDYVYIDIPMEDAMERAIERFMGPTNRYTSLMYLAFQDGKNIATLDAMNDVADGAQRIDNSQEKGEPMTPIEKEEEPVQEVEEETVAPTGQERQIEETELEAVGPMRMIKRHYPAPHYGRPGEVGGSSPRKGGQGASEGQKGHKQAGITSARPGKKGQQVFEEMKDFEEKLNGISTIRNPSVRPGLGGWEGGREPTWIVEYEGDGEAARLIADTAREHDQDAALIFEEAKGEGGSPVTDFIIGESVEPDERNEIETAMVESRLGGWTWMRTSDGRRLVRAVSIPQWGGSEEAHRQSVARLQDFFSKIGMEVELSEGRVKVSVLDRDSDYAVAEETQ